MNEATNKTDNNNTTRRGRLIKGFSLMFFVAIVMIWQVFSGYSESSLIKKDKYLTEFDLGVLNEGEVRIIHQSGIPIVIMRRSKQTLKELLAIRSLLVDPDSKKSKQPTFAKNYHRSLQPEFFIAFAVSADIGRDIHYRLKSFKPMLAQNEQWFGGFSESQSDSLYDKAGRIYKDKGRNLQIPNYRITPTNRLYVYTLKELDFE